MIIGNVRLGHATNSSSSHSIVIAKNKKDKEAIAGLKTNEAWDNEYGWEEFVLSSEKNKEAYLSYIVFDQLKREIGEEYAKIVMKELFSGFDGGGHIDHQSIFTLPIKPRSDSSWSGESRFCIDQQFLQDYRQYLKRNDIFILGGNDNCDWESEYVKTRGELESSVYPLKWPMDSGVLTARKHGDWWTLYNKGSGVKIDISFEKKPKPRVKAEVPDLVDLKITDYCPYGCKYCYQGSSSLGGHAIDMYHAIQELGKYGVFEVAIGGGEPTLSPRFFEELKNFYAAGVTPNFTTANKEWMKDKAAVEAVNKYCGSFAYSPRVENGSGSEDLRVFIREYEYHVRDGRRWGCSPVVVHIVMGTVDKYVFEDMVKMAFDAGLGVTLLGFKETGRGKQFKKELKALEDKRYMSSGRGMDYLEWLPALLVAMEQDDEYARLSVDTLLAKELEKVMDLPKSMYYTKEGFKSMYLDIVDYKFGSSSYSDNMLEIVDGHDRNYSYFDLKELFARVSEE